MGYDQYTVPDIVAIENTFVASFSTLKHTYKASRAILSNFVEELLTQYYPQYLSALSRALFPTTFLEIAVDRRRKTARADRRRRVSSQSWLL